MWTGVGTVLTRLFRRAHQDVGSSQGGLVDRRQWAHALADEFQRRQFIDIQHVQGRVCYWRTFGDCWRATMRLCEHPHALWQGWLFRLVSRKGPRFVRVLEPHVTHRPRFIAPHASCMRVASALAFDCTKDQYMQGQWRVQRFTLIFTKYFSHNRMASLVVKEKPDARMIWR